MLQSDAKFGARQSFEKRMTTDCPGVSTVVCVCCMFYQNELNWLHCSSLPSLPLTAFRNIVRILVSQLMWTMQHNQVITSPLLENCSFTILQTSFRALATEAWTHSCQLDLSSESWSLGVGSNSIGITQERREPKKTPAWLILSTTWPAGSS